MFLKLKGAHINPLNILVVLGFSLSFFTNGVNAQQSVNANHHLDSKQQSIIAIAALTAKGDLDKLKPALNTGVDVGLTINEIKEIMIHLYAYCGFPRSIRGLQTFMEVLDERKSKGIVDSIGKDASPIKQETTKYERGKMILGELTETPQLTIPSGYSAFAPTIDTFLKEHLFADIFERDVLTYAQRELVTISVISSIGNANPMLQSHLIISLNVGITPEQLQEFTGIIQSTIGEKEAKAARAVLNEVLKRKNN